jgi:glycosyltransferase involved in cell wall biosynthesis
MSRISVVVPCYNAAAFVRECLTSALAQTRPADEILFIDDRSTDGSAAIARSFGPRVRVIPMEENGGCARARNFGVAHATGDLIAFLDADDVWLPNHLATLEDLLQRHPDADVAFSRAQLFGDYDNRWWETIAPERTIDAFWECVLKVVAQPSSALVRAPVVKETAQFDDRLRHAEDFVFWLAVSQKHWFVCTDTLTTMYRKYPGQTSRDVLKCKRAEFGARKEFWERAQDNGSPEYLEALRHAMNRAWERHLIESWNRRRTDLMDFYLSLADCVPSSRRLERVWRRRRHLMALLRAWDRLPRPMRDSVKLLVPRPAPVVACVIVPFISIVE